ncbi:long-chain fatty acid transport protein 4-like [Ostrinia nubilalis]|uniref:long-chain fatty acid transport protein 4-like n=1 Tax=Ostrinia nubilalis TaxID=29057 RepID=UPI0030824DBD
MCTILEGLFQDWTSGLLTLVTLWAIYWGVSHWRWCYVAAVTLRRDFKALHHYIRMLLTSWRFSKNNLAISDYFHNVVQKHPNKSCFLMDDEVWTFQQVEEFSLRTSAVLKAEGVKKGDMVGLMMSNCPELPAIWLGVTRLGAVVPLLNTNQTGKTLLHSINISKCNIVIYGDEYEEVFQDLKADLDPSTKLFKFNKRPLNISNNEPPVAHSANDFTSMLEATPPLPWFRSEGDGYNGKLLYIFTSGTTGLPKAAVISSAKLVSGSTGIYYFGGINSDDVVYCPMPLYHSAGGCVTIGYALIFGCTIALRKKFSASSYFQDCIKYNATAGQYIGEMCRYIMATPPSPIDKQHQVRVMYGNGMRPTIWPEFVKRFNIQRIAEFYGSTEGNANIVSVDNQIGAVGFIPRIMSSIYPIGLVKINRETGEPIRDSKGLCQLAGPGEPGVYVSKINPKLATRAYLGYVDEEASKKKIIRDVFSFGDSAFISGDILVADELGYLYFRDRTGDTFRWRGENVSTTEVEGVISKLTGQRDAVVYSVEIPNIEGRAGMCGIVDVDDSLDLDELLKDLSKDLPKYARPIFIRKMTSVDLTGTFKMRKNDLQKEGYDPSKTSDKLYYLDPKLDKYISLGKTEYESIISGQTRL